MARERHSMTLRTRIEDWVKSSKCNCNIPGVYCTYCEILFDVLDYIDSVEQTKSKENTNEPSRVDPECAVGSVVEPEKEAGAGEDPGASGHEEGERPAEPGGSLNESSDCAECGVCDEYVCDCVCGPS